MQNVARILIRKSLGILLGYDKKWPIRLHPTLAVSLDYAHCGSSILTCKEAIEWATLFSMDLPTPGIEPFGLLHCRPTLLSEPLGGSP